MSGEIPFSDPVIFESIDEETIAAAALRTKGAAGTSGMNADGWKRFAGIKKLWSGTTKGSSLLRKKVVCCRASRKPFNSIYSMWHAD